MTMIGITYWCHHSLVICSHHSKILLGKVLWVTYNGHISDGVPDQILFIKETIIQSKFGNVNYDLKGMKN